MNDGNATEKMNKELMEKPRADRDVPEAEQRNPGVPTTRPVEILLKQLGPKAVFGEPVSAGETTVISVSEIRIGFGFGGGQGRSAKPAHERATEEGSGSGSGARARVIPRGYLHITGTQVRFEPILDVTRMALAGMALMAWITYLISKALKR